MKKLFFLMLIFFNYQIIKTAHAKRNYEKKYQIARLQFENADEVKIFLNHIKNQKKENNFNFLVEQNNSIALWSKYRFSKMDIHIFIEDINLEKQNIPLASLPKITGFWYQLII